MTKNLTSLTFFTALALSPAAFADDYATFHVCQDQRIIHTSDGAEAGHVEYIIVDPSSNRIVSSVVTGGVVVEKFVAVPFESMRFNAENEIMLYEIT
ncbi:MAG: hypothetical protein JWO94_1692, partial [Verrucomicrobiaceae bacterium]|nr:hypothetical protein [Verrucomicrobiaceae bacterium]